MQKHSIENHENYLRLLMANQRSIYAYIVKRVPHSSDADDIMQDVAVILWEKFDQFQLGTSFVAWATAIARNRILTFVRTKGSERLLFSTETIEKIDAFSSPAKEHKDGERELLKRCMSLLPDKDRRLIQMRYRMNLTIKSLANEIGRPVTGLYYSLARIHNRLVDCVRRASAQEE